MNDNEVGGLVARQAGMGCAYQILLEMIQGSSAVQKYEYINPLTLELNPSAQRCLMRYLLGILLLEQCISLIYA
jgi:hypothetical protein